MHEHIATPHYPQAIWAFTYRGLKVEITVASFHGERVYSAWVDYAEGSAVAVPKARTQSVAIAQAKRWICQHFS